MATRCRPTKDGARRRRACPPSSGRDAKLIPHASSPFPSPAITKTSPPIAGTSSSSTARSAATATCRRSRPRRWACSARPRAWPAACSAACSGSVADSAYEVQRAVGGPAHDSALKDAVEGDRADVQAVHALRQLGLRADLLEQEGRPLRELRAGHGRRDGRRAGRGRARTDPRESAHRRLDEAARREDRSAAPSAATCGAKTQGGKFCHECGAPLIAEDALRRLRPRGRGNAEVLSGVRAEVLTAAQLHGCSTLYSC